MKQLVMRQIARPFVRSIGTVVVSALVAYGISEEVAQTISGGLVAALMVSVDMVFE
jgi:hypothetical protein